MNLVAALALLCALGPVLATLQYEEFPSSNFYPVFSRSWDPDLLQRDIDAVTKLDANDECYFDSSGIIPPGTPFSRPALHGSASERPMAFSAHPGILLFDLNGDEYLDILVSNGPGGDNLLYIYDESSDTYVDLCLGSGSTPAFCEYQLNSEDSSGVCGADIDNDGHTDVVILNRYAAPSLLKSDGSKLVLVPDGFRDVGGLTPYSELKTSITCSFGDIDQDGFVDLLIVSASNFTNQRAIFDSDPVTTPTRESNNIFFNDGSGSYFVDQDATVVGDLVSTEDITWSGSLVDIDNDGDLDIMVHDDQGAIPNIPSIPASQVGLIEVYINQGRPPVGAETWFTRRTVEWGFGDVQRAGNWMGTTFADYNCDGLIDHFGSNLGSGALAFGAGAPDGPSNFALTATSRWFLQTVDPITGQHSMVDSLVVAPNAAGEIEYSHPMGGTPFGWGVTSVDFDLDGDVDIRMDGGYYFLSNWADASNNAAYFENIGSCTGAFQRNSALESDVRHDLRGGRGLAVGDLNNDGYPDFVSSSGEDLPADFNGAGSSYLETYPVPSVSEFSDSQFIDLFTGKSLSNQCSNSQIYPDIPVEEALVFDTSKPGPADLINGNLVVEFSNGNTNNRGIEVLATGTVGLVADAKNNRDAVGAAITVTPKNGNPATLPIVAGGGTSSQDAFEKVFGLGQAPWAAVDVAWPYPLDASAPLWRSERRVWNHAKGFKGREVEVPEIPCNFKSDASALSSAEKQQLLSGYCQCVDDAIDDIVSHSILSSRKARFYGLQNKAAFFDFNSGVYNIFQKLHCLL